MPRFLLASVILVGGLLMMAPGAHALTVSPPIVDLSADLGTLATTTVRLFNETETPLRLSATVEAFLPSGVTTQPAEAQQAVLAWVRVQPRQLELPPGELTSALLTVQVPARATVGGHYARVIWEAIPQDGEGGDLNVRSRVGALLLLTVNGATRREVALRSVQLIPPTIWRASLPLTVAAQIENTGTVHVAPAGNVVITNLLGWTVATLPLNPSRQLVLPGETRTLQATWVRDRLPWLTPWLAGWPTLQAEVAQPGLGWYLATLNLEDTPTSTSASVGTWVVPIRLPLILFLILLIFSWWRRRFR